MEIFPEETVSLYVFKNQEKGWSVFVPLGKHMG